VTSRLIDDDEAHVGMVGARAERKVEAVESPSLTSATSSDALILSMSRRASSKPVAGMTA
jgi:hypothetical protein